MPLCLPPDYVRVKDGRAESGSAQNPVLRKPRAQRRMHFVALVLVDVVTDAVEHHALVLNPVAIERLL